MDVEGDTEPAGTGHEDSAREVRTEHETEGAGEMVAENLLKKGGVDWFESPDERDQRESA